MGNNYSAKPPTENPLDASIRKGKAGLFRNQPAYSPSRSKYSKASAIEKEPEANLDSKRLIGRSRLFKYLGNQEEEE